MNFKIKNHPEVKEILLCFVNTEEVFDIKKIEEVFTQLDVLERIGVTDFSSVNIPIGFKFKDFYLLSIYQINVNNGVIGHAFEIDYTYKLNESVVYTDEDKKEIELVADEIRSYFTKEYTRMFNNSKLINNSDLKVN